jgi:glutaredoxin 3
MPLCHDDAPVKIYFEPWCPYCDAAVRLARELGLPHVAVDLTGRRELREELRRETGQRTIPYVFVKGTFVGGYTDLAALHERGELEDVEDLGVMDHRAESRDDT